MYVCSQNSATALKTIPNPLATYVGGRTFTGVQFGGGVQGYVIHGQLTAMNMSNNRVAWNQRFDGLADPAWVAKARDRRSEADEAPRSGPPNG